jgi:hypothetical protein
MTRTQHPDSGELGAHQSPRTHRGDSYCELSSFLLSACPVKLSVMSWVVSCGRGLRRDALFYCCMFKIVLV